MPIRDPTLRSTTPPPPPQFYCTILSYWRSFKLVINHEVSAENQIIWNNRDILADGKPIFYNSWINKRMQAIPRLWKVKFLNTVSSKVQAFALPSTKIICSTSLGKSYLIPAGESKIFNDGFTAKKHPKRLYAPLPNLVRTKAYNPSVQNYSQHRFGTSLSIIRLFSLLLDK